MRRKDNSKKLFIETRSLLFSVFSFLHRCKEQHIFDRKKKHSADVHSKMRKEKNKWKPKVNEKKKKNTTTEN